MLFLFTSLRYVMNYWKKISSAFCCCQRIAFIVHMIKCLRISFCSIFSFSFLDWLCFGEFDSLLLIDFIFFTSVCLFVEYGVALLMNLCLRTSGRKKCATIAEQAITVLSTLLTHPNREVYYFLLSVVNKSELILYSIDSTLCKFFIVLNFNFKVDTR